MRFWLPILLGCYAAASANAAETAEQKGKRIVDEAIQALGGDSFLNMRDRVETGRAYSFFRSELSGLSVARIYTRYLEGAEPGGLASQERQSFGKKEEVTALLFTEKGAWELTFRGARPLADERYNAYKDTVRRNVLYILRQRLKEPGLSIYWKQSDFFENRPVEIVDITDADNFTVTVYFGRTDKLPIRQVYRRRNPQFKDFDTEVTVFAKYRDVGGVKWPFDIRRERNGEKIYEMFSESVETNKDLADTLFTLPADAKLLPKAK